MHVALGASAPIPQLAPLAFEQIIIAGGDEDISSAEIFDWVSPLLAGIPGGRWMSCQLDFGAGGVVTAHYRDGGSKTVIKVTLDAAAEATRALAAQLPDAQSMTMILLSDFTSQAVTLLDGVARWLNIYDIDQHELAHVLRLMGSFQTMLSKP